MSASIVLQPDGYLTPFFNIFWSRAWKPNASPAVLNNAFREIAEQAYLQSVLDVAEWVRPGRIDVPVTGEELFDALNHPENVLEMLPQFDVYWKRYWQANDMTGVMNLTVESIAKDAYTQAIKDVAEWLKPQRNDIPATSEEFANAIIWALNPD
jgi:hypothetical protein